jgi:hypothetical protein
MRASITPNLPLLVLSLIIAVLYDSTRLATTFPSFFRSKPHIANSLYLLFIAFHLHVCSKTLLPNDYDVTHLTLRYNNNNNNNNNNNEDFMRNTLIRHNTNKFLY